MGEEPGSLPTFLIVGAARSGSTALYRHLRAHPEVFLPSRKEIHFFDHNWYRGIDWYRRYYADAAPNQARGDATPSYLYEPEAAARMADVVPGAHLLAILRHPVDRAYSHYWLNRGQGREKLSFEEALAAEADRLATGKGLEPGVQRRRWAYVDRGRYLAQLRRLGDHFPRERLLVLVFEHDLRDEPAATYASVCRFIGVDDGFAAPQMTAPVNRPLAYRSMTVRRAAARLPPRLKPVARALSRVNARPISYPPMDPGTRARLLADYEADNAELAEWLGRDLSVWSC